MPFAGAIQGVRIVKRSTLFCKAKPFRLGSYRGLEEGLFSSIFEACEKGRIEQVRGMLDENPALTVSVDDSESTPLHCAASRGHENVAELLISRGAELEARDFTGITPLGCAALNSFTDMMRLLLAMGAEVDASDADGRQPLHLAVESEKEASVDLLLAWGANPNARTGSGLTPLHIAAERGLPRITEILLRRRARPEIERCDGMRPLHCAAASGSADVTELLLQHGVDVDPKDGNGMTPLHVSAFVGNREAAKVLLDKGATRKPLPQGLLMHVSRSDRITEYAKTLREFCSILPHEFEFLGWVVGGGAGFLVDEITEAATVPEILPDKRALVLLSLLLAGGTVCSWFYLPTAGPVLASLSYCVGRAARFAPQHKLARIGMGAAAVLLPISVSIAIADFIDSATK
jgi:ankyrin repeat protein